MIQISIVIPTRRENDESYLLKMASHYPEDPRFEYLVVDTETSPELLNKIKRSDFSILRTKLQTRAERLKFGWDKAQGEWILFHHPRSLLDPTSFEQILNLKAPRWGGFTHQFDVESLGLRFTSWYSNRVRPRLWKILYLDHCLFFKKEMLNREIPNVPIFEDTEISKILRQWGPPLILPLLSTTSAIRFQQNGFWRQGLKNQWLKVAYFLGQSPKKMNDFYEKRLNLN